MRALIRFLTRAPGGAVETRERIFEGDALTLGRATDQVLQFKDRRVAFQHARVYRRDERIVLSCRAPATLVVNEALVRDAELAVGDVIRLGANILTIIAPSAGTDVAFTFELDPAAAGSDAEVVDPRLRLRSGRLGKRGWSWLLFLGILAAFLVVPLAMLPVKAGLEARCRATTPGRPARCTRRTGRSTGAATPATSCPSCASRTRRASPAMAPRCIGTRRPGSRPVPGRTARVASIAIPAMNRLR